MHFNWVGSPVFGGHLDVANRLEFLRSERFAKNLTGRD